MSNREWFIATISATRGNFGPNTFSHHFSVPAGTSMRHVEELGMRSFERMHAGWDPTLREVCNANREGLTFVEWAGAARVDVDEPDPMYLRSWVQCEDPTEYADS